MTQEKITISLDEKNAAKAIDFYSVYELESHFDTDHLTSNIYIGDKSNRVCRFCNESKPNASFKKKAHIVPQFLGNRYLLSGFECDTCNKFFGDLYEDSFANYMGAYRPLSFVQKSKNKKFPKHKETALFNSEEKLKLSIQQTGERNAEIVFEHPFDESLVFDRDNKIVTINATRKPYTPIYVYKMLLKIAISMIKIGEVDSFKNTLGFLKDNSQNHKFKDFGLCRVYIHALYGPTLFPAPSISIYRKKIELENELYPSKTFIMYTSNHIYQIFIPLNDQDKNLLGKQITILPFPILFDASLYEKGLSYNSYSELMTNHERVFNEAQKLTFSYKDSVFHEDENNGSS